MRNVYLFPLEAENHNNFVWRSPESGEVKTSSEKDPEGKLEKRRERLETRLENKQARIENRIDRLENREATEQKTKRIQKLKEKYDIIEEKEKLMAEVTLQEDLESADVTDPNWCQEKLSKTFSEGKIIDGSLWDKENCVIGKEIPVQLPEKDELIIGLGDILPPEVGEVEVKEPNGMFRKAVRRGLTGGFYYENGGGYAKILNGGYAFKITKLRSEAEIAEIKKRFDDKYAESFNKIDDFNKEVEINGEKVSEKKLIYEMAMRYGLDPHFLLALRRQENGGEGQEFGIKSAETNDYLNQLNMSARSIQNSMNRYEGVFNKSPLNEGGFLSVEFIALFSDRYCPPELGGVNENHLPGIAKMYGRSIGKESEYTLSSQELRDIRKKVEGYRYISGREIRFADPESLEEVERMKLPTIGRLSSDFGPRLDPFNRERKMHSGIDIANKTGTQVKAAQRGIVTFSGRMGGYGNMIEIDHGHGYRTRYAHLSSKRVAVGTIVEQGELIGAMGSSGRSTGSHLHFEVRRNNTPVNPESYLVG